MVAAADRIASRRKPLIAAVAGYALGGGFELALMCDFIFAADNVRFGLPEITLGVLLESAAPSVLPVRWERPRPWKYA
jgi:enoyl-CoA hydratase/carnithine racemase